MATLSCSECDRPAEFLCISVSVYLCGSHTEEHKTTCPKCDLYPIDQAELFMSIPHGGIVLKRGKVIAAAKQLLREKLERVETDLKQKLENEFLSVITELEAAKNKFLTVIEANVRKVRKEVEATFSRLEAKQQVEDFDPENKLEDLILTLDLSKLSTVLAKEQWFDLWANQLLIRDATEKLFRLERCETLLEEVEFECPWAYKYYFVPSYTSQFINLETLEKVQSTFTLPYKTGMVWTFLPNGQIFICGDADVGKCFLIDKNYLSCKSVCSLNTHRDYPGLAYFNKKVYIFGGSVGNETFDSVEIFSLRSQESTQIYSKMFQSRAVFQPCVWNSQVVIAGGIPVHGVEIFHPTSEDFTIMNFFVFPGRTVALSFSCEEVLFLSNFLYSSFPEQGRCNQISQDSYEFKCAGVPVFWNGCFYLELEKPHEMRSIGIDTYELKSLINLQ